MHYDPTTGCTIGSEATALANYYQCFEDMDGKMEFTNVGDGIGGGFKNTMELKTMKYKEATNGQRPGRKKLTMNMMHGKEQCLGASKEKLATQRHKSHR